MQGREAGDHGKTRGKKNERVEDRGKNMSPKYLPSELTEHIKNSIK